MNTSRLYQVITENQASIREDVYDILLGMVNEELAREAEKAAGRKPITRNAVKKFLSKDNYRKFLQKGNIQVINGTTYYGYCDGYKLAWSPIDFGFGVVDEIEAFKWKSVVDGTNKNTTVVPFTKEMKTELNLILKTKKDRPIYTFKVEDFEVDVNAEYLKAALDFTEATEVRLNTRNYCNPIVMDGIEDRHALILPIRR
jgi:hypothetical protein